MHATNPYLASNNILLWLSIWLRAHTFDIFVIYLPYYTTKMEASASFNLCYEYSTYYESSFGTPNL